jgi:hypothetical protein
MLGTPLTVNEADLERMSDDELATLEDRLLLETELDSSPKARFSAGKAVVWVLSAVGIGIMMGIYSRFPTERLGPLNIPIYLGVLVLGIVAGHKVWSAAGRQIRTVIRWLLGHWPAVLYVSAQIYSLTRG